VVKLLIENAVLIDGNGSSPMRNAGVLIDYGRIEAVGRGLDAPRGAGRIDAEGMTLMPGLMDLHVHMAGESLGRQMRLLEEPVDAHGSQALPRRPEREELPRGRFHLREVH